MFSFRISGELREKINAVEKATGMTFTDIARAASESVADSFLAKKRLVLPFRMVPEHEYQELLARIRELETKAKEKPTKAGR